MVVGMDSDGSLMRKRRFRGPDDAFGTAARTVNPIISPFAVI